MTSKTLGSDTWTYEYDSTGNLVKMTPPSGPEDYFTYNSGGERIKTICSWGTRNFFYAGGNLVQELDTSGNIKVWYNPGISQTADGTKRYFRHDAQGSMVALTKTSVSPEVFIYDAWGNRVYHTGTTFTPYRYVGKEGYYYDLDTGLTKLGARYYDPKIGRFITKDPARDGLNWYAYAGNDPVNLVDPSGLHHIVFSGERLKLFEDGGSLVKWWPAFSGQPGAGAASHVSNEGPIPPGDYHIRPNDFYYYTTNIWKDTYLPHTFGAPDKNGITLESWGNARTRIYPANMDDFSAANPSRNGSFYIHGGKYVGSIGCIDVGSNDFDVASTLSSLCVPTAAFGFVEHETIGLTVDYSGWKGSVPGISCPGITWEEFLH